METEKTLQEKLDKLQRRIDNGLSEDEVIELCFSIIKYADVIKQSRAAVILSGIVKPGLGKKTQEFLKENPPPALPDRVYEILGSSIMRMEGF